MASVREIAEYLSSEWRGRDLQGLVPASVSGVKAGTVVFLGRADEELEERLRRAPEIACITTEALAENLSCSLIIHEEPRLAFARVLEKFFSEHGSAEISVAATVGSGAAVGVAVSIGPGTRVGPDVSIGDHCRIGSNVVITGKVSIGHNCIIKSNTTIGEPGFGFPLDADGVPVRFPHIGSVKIGNWVEIGSNCTVSRAALDQTVIEDYVKTDDHVHIAHNCHIGARTRIAAGAVLSGSVRLGRDVWISPNSTIIDYATVGDKAFVGIGSVVTKPVGPGVRVFGVPAKPIGRR